MDISPFFTNAKQQLKDVATELRPIGYDQVKSMLASDGPMASAYASYSPMATLGMTPQQFDNAIKTQVDPIARMGQIAKTQDAITGNDDLRKAMSQLIQQQAVSGVHAQDQDLNRQQAAAFHLDNHNLAIDRYNLDLDRLDLDEKRLKQDWEKHKDDHAYQMAMVGVHQGQLKLAREKAAAEITALKSGAFTPVNGVHNPVLAEQAIKHNEALLTKDKVPNPAQANQFIQNDLIAQAYSGRITNKSKVSTKAIPGSPHEGLLTADGTRYPELTFYDGSDGISPGYWGVKVVNGVKTPVRVVPLQSNGYQVGSGGGFTSTPTKKFPGVSPQ